MKGLDAYMDRLADRYWGDGPTCTECEAPVEMEGDRYKWWWECEECGAFESGGDL